ncbi:MAG: bifunctional metallophosphatase/5'-nucleotidase [Planctomycetia bacterium]|nr:bifunctional metallophosphatase/5'-nucleotidase [Planctomycetia bacterium]
MSEQRLPRRDFLTGVAAATVAGSLTPALVRAAELGRARTISIFHTTDLHGRILPTSTYEGLDDVGGFARCASCLRQWRRESPHSITVDVGDVVQGTAVSLECGGTLMIDLFNRLGYDAWTLGNHDFDWGPEKLEALLERSTSSVLTANLTRGGAAPGAFDGAWKKVLPWTIREVGGFRVGLVGLITPGLPFWLPPELLGGATATDPREALEATVAVVRGEQVDAVVVMGHMGWRFNDDYANPVRSILKDVEGVDVYLAGHSHQNQPSWTMHDVLCSQASYHGIHCGRVDLTFDLETRKLVDRRAFTLLMDDRFPLDPAVMEFAKPGLEAADATLARDVATVTRVIPGHGRGSELAKLLCACFADALKKQAQPVDGVFHGTFETGDLQPGVVTIADCWRMIPFENMLVTAEVTAAELLAIVAEDAKQKKSDRTLWPFEVVAGADGTPAKLTLSGADVPPEQRLTIGFNAYDAQSGGRRLMQTREILAADAAKRRTSNIDSRSALIDGLLDRGTIG